MQTWLGHEDAALMLSVYAQLTSDDLPVVEWDTPRVHVVSTLTPDRTTDGRNGGGFAAIS